MCTRLTYIGMVPLAGSSVSMSLKPGPVQTRAPPRCWPFANAPAAAHTSSSTTATATGALPRASSCTALVSMSICDTDPLNRLVTHTWPACTTSDDGPSATGMHCTFSVDRGTRQTDPLSSLATQTSVGVTASEAGPG